MPFYSTINSLQFQLNEYLSKQKTIGFVPTMGALHEGHLSLMKNSLEQNDYTVVSVFVNPTQFNNISDLEKYPRNVEKDYELIQNFDKNIILFAPSVEEIYDGKTVSKAYYFDGIELELEGKHRLGHFNGVGTIVEKLFRIIKPTNAYFGEKDFQQLQIIKKLVKNYDLPVQVVGCSILREKNGLAMSSRNERLSKTGRENAKIIYQILKKSVVIFKKKSVLESLSFVQSEFLKHKEFTLEYFEIASEETLKPIEKNEKSQKYRGFIAVFLEGVRLIDNIPMY